VHDCHTVLLARAGNFAGCTKACAALTYLKMYRRHSPLRAQCSASFGLLPASSSPAARRCGSLQGSHSIASLEAKWTVLRRYSKSLYHLLSSLSCNLTVLCCTLLTGTLKPGILAVKFVLRPRSVDHPRTCLFLSVETQSSNHLSTCWCRHPQKYINYTGPCLPWSLSLAIAPRKL
jgi:hypothetical protein